MLSQKLTRITLKMTDFEEYEQVKRDRERAMDTSAVSSHSQTESRKLNTPASSVSQNGGGRRPVRASTPDSPPT